MEVINVNRVEKEQVKCPLFKEYRNDLRSESLYTNTPFYKRRSLLPKKSTNFSEGKEKFALK